MEEISVNHEMKVLKFETMIKVLKFESIDENINREEIVKLILTEKDNFEKIFQNNEYLKIDLTNKEVIGFKSTAKLAGMELGDLSSLNFILAHTEKYKNANLLNLGNVNKLYEKFEE